MKATQFIFGHNVLVYIISCLVEGYYESASQCGGSVSGGGVVGVLSRQVQ